MRRFTFIAGHGTPLTRMTSPYMPEWSLVSNRNSPCFVNILSPMISGTSNSPFGSGSARSRGSNRWYCPAMPMFTFSAVWWTPWSWYQSVRAGWKFG